MTTHQFERSPCPVCAEASVVQITPATIPVRKPSHQCSACGTGLVAHLNRKAWVPLLIGLLLMVMIFATYELSKTFHAISPGARGVTALVLLAGVWGFAASRVLGAIEFKVWPKST
jgi:hypothetical protein